MIEFITNVVMDCGQVKLGKACGKFFNIMYDNNDCITVESFEPRNTIKFTNINRLTDDWVEKIYNDLYEDFGD